MSEIVTRKEFEEKRRALQEPLLKALFDRLPPAGAVWPVHERAAWLKAMEATVDLLYGIPDSDADETTAT